MRCDDDFLYRKKDEQGFRRGALLFLFQLTVIRLSADLSINRTQTVHCQLLLTLTRCVGAMFALR